MTTEFVKELQEKSAFPVFTIFWITLTCFLVKDIGTFAPSKPNRTESKKDREMNFKKHVQKIIPLILGLFFLVNVNGSTINPSIFDLMNHEEVLELNLESNFSTLINNRRFSESLAAKLSFKDENKIVQSWNIKIKLRGKYRRMNCEMPPLKLDFNKEELQERGLAKYDDLKLVTQCLADKQQAKELLMKEYLTYKLYNELTDNSYRVQLVRIVYKDISTGKKSKEWAFLIEDSAQLANRLEAKKVKRFNVPFSEFDQESLNNTILFQYMIGNSDWELGSSRNVKMFEKKGKIILVPYDFDFSGLVDAPYAIPNPNYNLKSTKDRVLVGYSFLEYPLHANIYNVHGKRATLIKLIKEFKNLPLASRFEMIEYLNSYFLIVEDLENEHEIALQAAS